MLLDLLGFYFSSRYASFTRGKRKLGMEIHYPFLSSPLSFPPGKLRAAKKFCEQLFSDNSTWS
jgi:hypothetical protein